MNIGKQTRIEMDKYDTLQKIVDQLEYCNYETDGRCLTNNVAFLKLKEMAIEQQRISDTPTLSAVPSERDVEKFYNPIKNEINENKKRVIDNILAQREEILSAFISKHGFEPDEAEQIIVTSNDNLQTKWFVRKRGIAG